MRKTPAQTAEAPRPPDSRARLPTRRRAHFGINKTAVSDLTAKKPAKFLGGFIRGFRRTACVQCRLTDNLAVAAAIPMFFLFLDLSLIDIYAGAILIHALMNFPLATLLLKSFIEDIPPEIDEAAIIDGASCPLIFARLIAPSIRGGVAATAVLCFVFSWTEFLFVLSLTQAGVNTVPVAASTFVTSTGAAWGLMAALTCAATLPAMIFIMLVQKHLVRGLTLGSMKG